MFFEESGSHVPLLNRAPKKELNLSLEASTWEPVLKVKMLPPRTPATLDHLGKLGYFQSLN